MAGIAAPTPEHRVTLSIYPRLAYRDEAAALEFLVRGLRVQRTSGSPDGASGRDSCLA